MFLESAHVSPQESGARIEISKTENEGGKAGERTVYISGLQDKGTPVCQVWFALLYDLYGDIFVAAVVGT